MRKLEVFDPPLCCPTGVCGPSVDPAIVRFAADLEWLKGRGIKVRRFGLSQVPGEFIRNAVVKGIIEKEGTGCLPLILVDGEAACKGRYPVRDELARLAGLRNDTPIRSGKEPQETALDTQPKEANA